MQRLTILAALLVCLFVAVDSCQAQPGGGLIGLLFGGRCRQARADHQWREAQIFMWAQEANDDEDQPIGYKIMPFTYQNGCRQQIGFGMAPVIKPSWIRSQIQSIQPAPPQVQPIYIQPSPVAAQRSAYYVIQQRGQPIHVYVQPQR